MTTIRDWAPGDRVILADGSDRDGETCTVQYTQPDGLVIIGLHEDGALVMWPVEPWELEPAPEPQL